MDTTKTDKRASMRELKRTLTLTEAIKTNLPCLPRWQEYEGYLQGVQQTLQAAMGETAQLERNLRGTARQIRAQHARKDAACDCPVCKYAAEPSDD